MKPGTLLRFREVKEAGDDQLRFVVIEDRGDRVLVIDSLTCSWNIKPTCAYAKADLIEVDHPVEVAMSKLGFFLLQTGGGCTAYEKRFENGWHLLLTVADDAAAPESLDEPASCGYYRPDQSEALLDVEAPTALEAVAKMFEAIGVPS